MAATVTLAQLRTRSRLYADERPGGASAYLTDTEVNDLVNMALGELYDRLVAARGHEYYVAFETIATAAGTALYALPDDHFETKKLTIQWGARDLEPMRDLDLDELDHLENWATWGRWSPKGFRHTGAFLQITPTPTSAVDIELRYVPTFTALANDAATFDGINGWDKSVALRTAIEIRTIQQEDASDLERLYERELLRIEGLAADRAAREPKRVRDVQPEHYLTRWPERLPRA